MPFVRYARDRRGYETLYVMHAFDEGGRGRPRVLYACRTVPYAKVGRTTLDESVQRRLETAYPALQFDWPKLLKEAAQGASRPPQTSDRAEGRGQRAKGREGRGQRERKEGRGAGAPRETREQRPPREQREPARTSAPPQEPAEIAELDTIDTAESLIEPEHAPEIDHETLIPLEPVTELIEWTGEPAEPTEPVEPADQRTDPEAPEEPVEPVEPFDPGRLEIDPSWPAVNVLGSERTLILRGRFIELAHRVMSRVEEPSTRNRLLGLVVRLNPEGWKTDEEARASAAAFESTYEHVSRQLRR